MLRSSFTRVSVITAVLLFVLTGPFAVWAQPDPIELGAGQNVWKLGAHQFELSEDIPDAATVEDVLAGTYEKSFARSEQSVPNFSGYDQAVWGRMRVTNPEARASRVSLAVKYPQLDRIHWYIVDAAGDVETASAGQFVPRDRE